MEYNEFLMGKLCKRHLKSRRKNYEQKVSTSTYNSYHQQVVFITKDFLELKGCLNLFFYIAQCTHSSEMWGKSSLLLRIAVPLNVGYAFSNALFYPLRSSIETKKKSFRMEIGALCLRGFCANTAGCDKSATKLWNYYIHVEFFHPPPIQWFQMADGCNEFRGGDEQAKDGRENAYTSM